MKKVLLVLVLVVFAFGCSQNSKKPGSESAAAAPAAKAEVTADQPIQAVSKEQIDAAYDSVVLTVVDKVKNTNTDVVVKLNGEAKVEGTPLTVKVIEFYPDFVMGEGNTSTTRSLEANNPAVKLQIIGTEPEYIGWQFEKFPDIHPYDHPTYGVIMKGVNKK